jgi:mRNA-degrading endonuclease RelE of RelBE toxin-antitoxin system
VTYRVEFAAAADAQLYGLPDEAFAGLVDALVKVSRDPWGAKRAGKPRR